MAKPGKIESQVQWAPQERIVGRDSNDTPALVTYQNKLWSLWNGARNDGIFFSTFDGSSWTGQDSISFYFSDKGPATAVYDNKIFVAWKTRGSSQILNGRFNGFHFTDPAHVPGIATNNRPSLAAFDGKLFMAWNGVRNDGIFYATFQESTGWSSQAKIPGSKSDKAPTLVVFEGKLMAAWKKYDDNNIEWSQFDGVNWTPLRRASRFGTSSAPTLATYRDLHNPQKEGLYLTWKGGDDNNIWWAHFDGGFFLNQIRNPFGTKTAPGMVAFRDSLYMLWDGDGNDGIFFSTLHVGL